MEKGLFPEVSGTLKKTVEARLHTDRGPIGVKLRKLQIRMTKVSTLPVYLVVDPKTEEILSRLDGARRSQFVRFLKKGGV
ncbi:MAG: hypothetical protein CMJ85_04895 [Planctomycetes bacterium]|jgi:hypothetical protein|nr:hypothetical protein [Planctomycetota bacterium]MDP6424152.1 hypothetical protein [Planctomycetota bacterium]